jgi:ABC-type antimicrobial peptide transport system permease subunit
MVGGSWSHHVVVGAKDGSSKFTYVSPTYFAAMGIPLLTGRNFNDRDTNESPLVLIVNQEFLRKYVAAPLPIGQHVHVLPEPEYPERTYEIIGTIPDTKYGDVREPTPPMAFVPIDQYPVTAQGPGMAMMIASRDPAAAQQAVRHLFEQKHPGTILQFFDFEQWIRDRLVGDRMMAMLSGFFGVLAALLVVVGLYGVLSYFLAQRRSEIGIRMALGASRGRVIRGLLRDAVAMLLMGLAAGTALALVAGREASTMLFGLKPWDPVTLAAAAALLGLVTVVTSLVPALKAANLDPVASLRAE